MTLSSPLFLIGLVAVAIPVIVHLFNFRRYKKVYFSNVERLEQLQSETRKQSTLRQLLIMAARIMAIVYCFDDDLMTHSPKFMADIEHIPNVAR